MQRKTVTVVFCDMTGSTALGESIDPEALQGLLARYFGQMKTIIERHGGTVEKFIGDAVMAVFGTPVVHEDDALRAVRAAAEMQEALPNLGVEGRIGVNTGEVVTGTDERLATGDAVNVAARLEQAAQPGEVLIGATTFALVAEAVEVDPVTPLQLKGKAAPVGAYRLLKVHDAPERRHEGTFVGRRRDIGSIGAAWERVRNEERCEMVTITADAGVGKSRLVAEAMAHLSARVVRGRCLPYGEGITYWPVVEVVKQLDVIVDDPAVTMAIHSMFGETESATSGEEIAWGVRKTFEKAASVGPLAVVFDDIHWGDEAFLDLIEHVVLLSSGAPILLLCLARPELLERRPRWPVTIALEPLGNADVEELIPVDVSTNLRQKIAQAAGGNPLFVVQMVAMADAADAEVIVPPTLQALLAARIDQLDLAERGVLERAAVEGEVFHRGAVQALAPHEPQVTPRLAALVRRGMIRADKTELPGEDGFRFRHLLIRNAAYESLPKSTRAEFHAMFAGWLVEHGRGVFELDELVGHHLEQACRYRAQLGMPVDDELAASASRRLTSAGVRARLRGDHPAALRLCTRAVTLLPADEVNLDLEDALIESMLWLGRGNDALQRAGQLTQRAGAQKDRVTELCGLIEECLCRSSMGSEGEVALLESLLAEAVPSAHAAHNDSALYIVYAAQGHVANMSLQMDRMLDAYESAATHAQRAGRPYLFLSWRAIARLYGTTPLSELLGWLNEQEATGHVSDQLLVRRASALAMLGRCDEARNILAGVRARTMEMGTALDMANQMGHDAANVELAAGDPAAAVAFGEEAMRLYAASDEHSFASTAAAGLAEAYFQLDHLSQARSWADHAAELGQDDDLLTQIIWRQVRAKICAREGSRRDAENFAREALVLAEKTDSLGVHADAYQDLGEVLVLADRREEAAAAYTEALASYERKENLVMAARVKLRLAELSKS